MTLIFPVKQFQTHYEIIHKLKEDYEQTLSLTANLFSLDQLKRVVSTMKRLKSLMYIHQLEIFLLCDEKLSISNAGNW